LELTHRSSHCCAPRTTFAARASRSQGAPGKPARRAGAASIHYSTAWHRLTRAANVVRGAQQWLDRLDNYNARQRELAAQREAEDNVPAASALRREAEIAQAIRTDVATLRAALQPPIDRSPWGHFVTWAERLVTDLCGGTSAWAEEAAFAEDVARVLAELRQADLLETDGGTSLELFVVMLRDALEGRARPVGGLGRGILIGPVQSVTGLAFDRVFIVGMTDGAYPTPAPDDPFFPNADEDPLHLRQRQRQTEPRVPHCHGWRGWGSSGAVGAGLHPGA